jgi:hypothetical protein
MLLVGCLMLPIPVGGVAAVPVQGNAGSQPANNPDARSAAASNDITTRIERVQQEISEIRRLPFKSTVQYATAEPSRVVQRGKQVTIVEGGTEGSLDSLLRVASKATSRAPDARK